MTKEEKKVRIKQLWNLVRAKVLISRSIIAMLQFNV